MSALEHMVARIANDPLFLACALAEFARSRSLDDAGLAAALGCPLDQLTRLKLCGAPRADHFNNDVAAIAGRFGIDPEALAEVVTLGQSVARLRASKSAEAVPGFLLAARDDDRAQPPPEDAP